MYKRYSTYITESIPTRTQVSLFIAVFGLISIGAVVPSAPAQPAVEPDPSASYTTLLARADREGSVRVLVELDVDALSQTASPNQALVSSQVERVHSTQTRFLDRMRDHFVWRNRAYDQLPYVALTLDSDALEATAADPEVITIHEDRFLRSTLADSTVLIGATEALARGYGGAGQTVALLDTGVDASHPFFGGRIVHQACFSSNEPAFGVSTLCPNGATSQIGGMAARPCAVEGCIHGTLVAGIAAGDGEDFSGVAPEAGILAVQVFSRVTGWLCTELGLSSPCVLATTSDLLAALEHVHNRRNAFDIAAVNLSVGDGHYTTPCNGDPLRSAIDLLRAKGIATVIAAGNDGYTNAITAPACISSAISVGSTTKSDKISSFSNSAPMLDLLAPGSRIHSSVPGGGFATFSGTSLAAPHVTGAFAVLRSAVTGASTDDILGVLQTEGEPILDPDNGLTRSRIQVDLAAEQLIADDTPPPTIDSLAADRALPQFVNSTINFAAQASGGIGKYDYRWWIVNGTTRKSAGEWQQGRNTFRWTPTSPSPDYKIVVWARNAGQTTGLPRGKAAMTYPINAP